jgi:LmbE family N-acetylglucosaminyl deacetylase
MLGVSLASGTGPPRSLLAIGCHCDDIEIGCGGTILALTRALPQLHVTWVVLSASEARGDEARASAAEFLAAAEDVDVRTYSFRDGFLPYAGTEVKEVFESLKPVEPDVILTHTRFDLHQDHRLACELTWNTFREHLILEYEIPKYDGDLGQPNLFVPLDGDLVDEKLRLLESHFESQAGKHWFDDDLFRGLLRLRGMEAPSATRYAEAFTCRKLTVTV